MQSNDLVSQGDRPQVLIEQPVHIHQSLPPGPAAATDTGWTPAPGTAARRSSRLVPTGGPTGSHSQVLEQGVIARRRGRAGDDRGCHKAARRGCRQLETTQMGHRHAARTCH